MNYYSKLLLLLAAGWVGTTSLNAQDRVHYTGTELSNPNHHDGQLSPVVGVHNIQTMRANRRYDLYATLSLIHISEPTRP